MQEIKKIISKISFFTIDILVFAFNVWKQVILPGKRKKGNVLSSLFIFFTGILERIGSFEYGIFQMANVLKQKYIKQSLLLIAALLFLLSSFEWTGEKTIYNNYSGYTTQLCDTYVKKSACNYCKTTIKSNVSEETYRSDKNICLRRLIPNSSLKRFLLIGNIRV